MENTETVIDPHSRRSLQRLVGRWRWIPKIRYTNFHKAYPITKDDKELWQNWFSVKRYWGGRIIYLSIRHFQLSFDFRRSVWADMMYL